MLVDQEMGLMRQVSGEATLATLPGHVAIGPTRSSTAEGSCWESAQLAFKFSAAGGGMVAHNGNLTNTAALAGPLIPQELPSSGPVQPRAASDTAVIAELLAREADLSLEGAIVCTIPRRAAFTEPVVPAAIGRGRGLCRAWVTTLRPFVTTQPATLPLPNPEPEVAR